MQQVRTNWKPRIFIKTPRLSRFAGEKIYQISTDVYASILILYIININIIYYIIYNIIYNIQ